MIRFALVVVPVAACLVASSGEAQRIGRDGGRGPAPATSGQNQQLRTYPVSDIVLEVSDYPYDDAAGMATSFPVGGGFGGGGFGGGGFGGGYAAAGGGRQAMTGFGGAPSAPASATISLPSLIDALIETVEPDTWAASGGAGNVVPLGGMLVVSQTPEVHEHVGEFLRLVRRDAGLRRTVKIDARWLRLDSDELARLAPEGDGGEYSIDQEALAEFTRRPSSLRALTTCFSGQLVHLVSGTRRNIVRSYIPVVGSAPFDYGPERALTRLANQPVTNTIRFIANEEQALGGGRSVGYQPVVESVNLGVTLELRPTIVGDAAMAIVDVRSTLSVDNATDAKPPAAAEGVAGGVAPQIDRVSIDTAQIATTFRMPLGRPALVGGLSYSPAAAMVQAGAEDDARGDKGELSQAYLVLEVRRAD